MSYEFVSNVTIPIDFQLEMLERLTLEANPYAVCEDFGLSYDQIKNLPHFQAQQKQVEQALLVDGRLTDVVAGVALHEAVVKLAYRVQDDRMPTGDLVKVTETLKKIKDGKKDQQTNAATQGVSLVINIPAIGDTSAKTISITAKAPTASPDDTHTLPETDYYTVLD